MKNILELFKKKKEPEADADRSDKEYSDKLKRHKFDKLKRNLIIAAAIVVVGAAVYLYVDNRSFSGYEKTQNLQTGDTTQFKLYEYGDYYLKYSDDGLACMNGGDVVWNQGFEMKQPIIDICKDYVAIAQQRSNDIYIFDRTGLQGKVKTSYPILSVHVANQGVVAAITEDGDLNHIELIDKSGNLLAMGQTVLSGDGCPISMDLSQDGTKLVVSYLFVSGGVTQTRVVFYNYSEVGKNEVDRVVGGFNQYKTTIVPKVAFITNDIAIAFGDDMLTIYTIKQKPSIVKEYKLERQVKSIVYNEEYIGLVYEGENIDDEPTICIYDLDGDIIYDGAVGLDYNNIKLDGDNLLIYNNDTFMVKTVKGRIKYEGTIEGGIKDIIGLNGGYTYLLISNESIDKIKLK